MLAEMIDKDYQEENKTVLLDDNSLGHLLAFPCPLMNINGKLQHHNSGRTPNGMDTSGIMVCINYCNRSEPRLAEVLAEGKQNTE